MKRYLINYYSEDGQWGIKAVEAINLWNALKEFEEWAQKEKMPRLTITNCNQCC